MEAKKYEMTDEDRELMYQIINDGMIKRDRSINLYFGEYGCSMSVFPFDDSRTEEE